MSCAACRSWPPDRAGQCPSCDPGGFAAVREAEQRRVVTIVFCDLVGSTELAGRLDPEILRSVTLRYYEAMKASIQAHGGTVEKFIGDAVMAVFGIPAMHEDDPRRALSAALEMLASLGSLNEVLQENLGIRLEVRIGVNTGEVVTARDTAEGQALVAGEAVNVAARLEQRAMAGQILVGQETVRAAGAAAVVTTVGSLSLRGKSKPVTAYQLAGVRPDAPEVTRRFDVPFIGREPELAELTLVCNRVGRQGCQLFTLYGEAGIGKTRLIREWLNRLNGTGTAVGAGRCRPYGESGTLTPLAEAVATLLETTEAEHGDSGQERAVQVLRRGLLSDGTPNPSLADTVQAVAAALAARAESNLVIVVLDDCHWAAPMLLDVLEELACLLDRSPVLFLCAARPELLERKAAWGGGRLNASSLVISRLSATESAHLATALVEVGAHAPAAPGAAIERAEGNPLYLEQFLTALATDGEAEPRLPTSLHLLLAARIDALSAAERAALDLAAVIGREFAVAGVWELAQACGGPAPNPEPALRELCRRRLIEPMRGRGGEPGGFRFSSGLIREVAYQRLAKRTCAEHHERYATIAERHGAGHATVAGHLEQAYRYRSALGVNNQATQLLRQQAGSRLAMAGASALARSDLYWAADLLSRAVELTERSEPGWGPAAQRLAETALIRGQIADGSQLLREVLAVAVPAGDQVTAAHARLLLSVHDQQSEFGSPAAVSRTVIGVFEAVQDHLGIARATIRLAQEEQFLGEHRRAERLLATALAEAVLADAEPERAMALGAIGVSLWLGPTPAEAAIERCNMLLTEHGVGRRTVQATLTCPLAVLLAMQDRRDEARTCLGVAGPLANELGYAEMKALLPLFTAIVESTGGVAAEVEPLLNQSLEACRSLGDGNLADSVARELARQLLARGAWDIAATVIGETKPGLPRADAADDAGVRARISALSGRPEEALALAAKAHSEAAGTDSPLSRAIAELDRAHTFLALGRWADTAASAEAAARWFSQKGHLAGERQAMDLAAHARAKRRTTARRPGLTWGLHGRGPGDIAVWPDGIGVVTPEHAWGGSTGQGVRVCVVDSGIEPDHPLVGTIDGSYVVVKDDSGCRVVETEGGDACGHGTACAGIIRKAAPECELYSVRVLGDGFAGTGEVLLAGLRWAVQQGFDVVNMSLSTTRREFAPALHELADDAYFSRSVIVASAHNVHVESYPWRFSSVISVGSHEVGDPDLHLYNPDPPVEFFAQGQDVQVAWLGGRSIRTTGNSFATPRIAGLVTKILARYPRLTVFQLKSILYLTAANVRIGIRGAND
jgi:class 3 adenylate cyclase/subtilisin family serine protease